MSQRANATLIGAFVTGAIILVIVAIMLFGGEDIFTRRDRVVMYFIGSVNGLNIGAPVNVRGVKVGVVKEISIEFSTETGEFKVPVIAELEPGSIEQVQKLEMTGDTGDPIKTMIEILGLRAQLHIQSILTSQLYIQLDYHPGSEFRYYGDGSMIEIPTIPMPIEQFDKALEHISIGQMMVDISSSLNAINKLVNAPDLMETIKVIKQTFVSMETLADNTNKTLVDVKKLLLEMELAFKNARQFMSEDSPHMHKLDVALEEIATAAHAISDLENISQMRNLNTTLEEIAKTARTIQDLQDTPQMYNLNIALEEIRKAARAVRELAETIERQPEALLKGKGSPE